jgi:hypothetical protein
VKRTGGDCDCKIIAGEENFPPNDGKARSNFSFNIYEPCSLVSALDQLRLSSHRHAVAEMTTFTVVFLCCLCKSITLVAIVIEAHGVGGRE